jgi:hypothetical protein
MDESIGLAIVALNEAEALHRIEKLDRSTGFLAGQLTLRARLAATAAKVAPAVTATVAAATGIVAARLTLDRHWFAVDSQIGRGNAAATIDEREFQRLSVGKIGKSGLLDCRDVDEHIFAAVFTDDETETLLRVEEFDDAFAFANDLRGHAATAATTAAAKTTAAAAAEAAASTATVATAEAAASAASSSSYTAASSAAAAASTAAAAITAAAAATIATAVAAATAAVTAARGATAITTAAGATVAAVGKAAAITT